LYRLTHLKIVFLSTPAILLASERPIFPDRYS
jgi:hypothetical protein